MHATYVNARSKKDKKIELKAPDPQNLGWSKDTNRFGHKVCFSQSIPKSKTLVIS